MNKVASRFALHQLIHWAAVGIMVPVATLLLRQIGLTLLQVGFALAAYSLATVLVEVPSGALSDLWGRRRTYFLGTVFDLGAVALLLIAPGVPTVMLASGFRGAARAFVSGSLDALAIEAVKREDPEYDMQRFFARVGMVVPAGLALTSLLGGFLPELASASPFARLAAWSPAAEYSVNLIIHGVLVAIAGSLAFLLFREEPRAGAKTGDGDPDQRRGVGKLVVQIKRSVVFGFQSPALALMLLSTVAGGIVLLSVETFWQPRLASILAVDNTRLFGIVGASYFAIAVAGNAFSPLLVKLVGGNRAVGVLLYRFLSAVALAVLALQATPGGFVALYLVFFLFYATAMPVWEAMFNDLVPDDRRSTLLSVNSLMLQVGGFGGSLLFGYISQRFGIATSWIIAAGVFALSVLLYLPLIGDTSNRAATLGSATRPAGEPR